MLRELNRIVDDIRNGENIDNYTLIILSIVVAALGAFNLVSDSIVIVSILPVLALIVYSQIKINRQVNELLVSQSKHINGITDFYPDRTDLPSLDSRLDSARSEVAMQGLQLGSISHNYLTSLTKCATRGCSIKLLIMSPVDAKGNPLPWVEEVGRVHTFPTLGLVLRSNILHLYNWHSSLLDSKIKARIEIRLYPTIPTTSILLIDRNAEQGTIKIEPIIHLFPPATRPSFTITPRESPLLWDRTVTSFDNLWNSSLSLETVYNVIPKS